VAVVFTRLLGYRKDGLLGERNFVVCNSRAILSLINLNGMLTSKAPMLNVN
jgi:hypothetical protein